MIDYILTAVVLITLSIMFLVSIRRNLTVELMDKDVTTALRGGASIIILLVHIPLNYQNRLQDLIGSFAYIGVTIFFMLSTYGCRLNVDTRADYLKGFWKKRILALFIPAITLNIMNFLFKCIVLKNIEYSALRDINAYIWATLIAYVVFWLVWEINSIKCKDFVVCLVFLVLGLLTYFTKFKPFFIWASESFGLIIGIIVYHFRDQIKALLKNNTIRNVLVFGGVSTVLGVAYLKFKTVVFLGDYVLRIILGISIIAFILAATINFSFDRTKWMTSLGKISYSVYLGHLIVIANLVRLFPEMQSGMFILLTAIMTVAIAVVNEKLSRAIIQLVNKKC